MVSGKWKNLWHYSQQCPLDSRILSLTHLCTLLVFCWLIHNLPSKFFILFHKTRKSSNPYWNTPTWTVSCWNTTRTDSRSSTCICEYKPPTPTYGTHCNILHWTNGSSRDTSWNWHSHWNSNILWTMYNGKNEETPIQVTRRYLSI